MAHLIKKNKLCLFLRLEIAGEINSFTVVYLLLECYLWKRTILMVDSPDEKSPFRRSSPLQLITLYGLKVSHRHKTAVGVGDMAIKHHIAVHNVLYKNVKRQSLI